MKVCLVIPPSPFLLDERVFVSLGILKVAASLEAAHHEVEVLDLSGVENYEDVAAAHAAGTEARVYGVTATTPQLPAARRVTAALARGVGDRTAVKVILGGPHATLAHAAARAERARGVNNGRGTRALTALLADFDVVVAGDGEDAIHRALRQPSGLIDADDPAGPLFLTRARLAAAPLPARHLVDLASYRYAIDGASATALVAQLGCPYRCVFCGGRASPMLRRMRVRSTESVLAEVAHLVDHYGYRGLMLFDDELNVSKAMVPLMDGIADLADARGFDLRLRGFVKSELLTDEQAAVLRRAGFRWILVGFESGSPRILSNIEKQATVEDNDRCVEIARRHGLKVKALMSLGHAGESEETVRATQEWLLRTAPDDFDATIITTYPGSPYYDEAVEIALGEWTFTARRTGDRLHAVDVDYATVADYYKGVPGDYRAYVRTDFLSSERLVELRDVLEADVRKALGIPYNAAAPSARYEQSLGSSLPSSILRRSAL